MTDQHPDPGPVTAARSAPPAPFYAEPLQPLPDRFQLPELAEVTCTVYRCTEPAVPLDGDASGLVRALHKPKCAAHQAAAHEAHVQRTARRDAAMTVPCSRCGATFTEKRRSTPFHLEHRSWCTKWCRLDQPVCPTCRRADRAAKQRRRRALAKVARVAVPTCPHCGREFIQGRADQVFCSARCRVAAHRAARRAAEPEP